MRTRPPFSLWRVALLLVAGGMLLLGASVALALPPTESLNQPTPPPPPGGGGENGGTGFLAQLEGFVWENGDPQKPLSGVTVRYTSSGVSVDATTDKRGYWKLLNLGPDAGVFDLADNRWQSGTGGVILQPPPARKLQANLAALPRGGVLASKVTLSSSASPSYAAAGQKVTFTLKVTNGTQVAISGLTLGDQLPEGMTVAGVTTSRGDVVGQSANVVTVDLNSLAAGDSATVAIVAQVGQNAKPVSANRLTVFYGEGPAVGNQGAAGSSVLQALPVTGLGLPIAAIAVVVVLAVIVFVARRLRAKPAV